MKGPVPWRRTPSAAVFELEGVPMAVAPWIVVDALWSRVEPVLPQKQRRVRYPGRKRLDDRAALQGILFVLHTGMAWRHLPLELGFGSGSTCYRRMVEWQRAGVWEKLHALLLAELRASDEIEWSRAVADSSHVQAKKGAPRRGRARLIEPEKAPSITFSSTPPGSRLPGRSPAATATT
jgi:transposase